MRPRGGTIGPARALALERRRSRIPWIFLLYHARPRPGRAPAGAPRRGGRAAAPPPRVAGAALGRATATVRGQAAPAPVGRAPAPPAREPPAAPAGRGGGGAGRPRKRRWVRLAAPEGPGRASLARTAHDGGRAAARDSVRQVPSRAGIPAAGPGAIGTVALTARPGPVRAGGPSPRLGRAAGWTPRLRLPPHPSLCRRRKDGQSSAESSRSGAASLPPIPAATGRLGSSITGRRAMAIRAPVARSTAASCRRAA